MNYIYHYHAKVFLDGSVIILDGIAALDHPVESYAAYTALKVKILQDPETDLSGQKCAITSLTLLS